MRDRGAAAPAGLRHFWAAAAVLALAPRVLAPSGSLLGEGSLLVGQALARVVWGSWVRVLLAVPAQLQLCRARGVPKTPRRMGAGGECGRLGWCRRRAEGGGVIRRLPAVRRLPWSPVVAAAVLRGRPGSWHWRAARPGCPAARVWPPMPARRHSRVTESGSRRSAGRHHSPSAPRRPIAASAAPARDRGAGPAARAEADGGTGAGT